MLEAGDRIDVWVVAERLGKGGMGSVYRCHNADAERIEAAIKVLEVHSSEHDETRRRFIREAEILYRLKHPNIVSVRNIRMDASPPFIEMEFVEGRSVHELIHEGARPFEEVGEWMRQLASALHHMHEQGVRHRDVKPGNLLITSEGHLKLVDFGLALETDASRLTREGMSFGTVGYAPPEWMDPASLDPVQWDLYALGVVYYELLTGTYAFPLSGEGPLRKQLLQVALSKQSAPPLDVGERAPAAIRDLIRRLTDREPDRRPQSAAEVLEVIERPDAPRGSTVAETRHRRVAPAPVVGGSLLRTIAIAGVAVATVGVVFATAWLTRGEPEPSPSPAPSPPPPRAVEVRLDGLGELPAWVQVGDERVEVGEEGATGLLPLGHHELAWFVGPCTECPGASCDPACGQGVLSVVAGAGGGPLPVRSAVVVPHASVTVEVRSLTEAGGRLFRKRPELSGRLDGQSMAALSGWQVRASEVAPGKHDLVLVAGTCPAEAVGCHPGDCPRNCRSERRTVMVPWSAEPIRVQSTMPAPD